MGAESWAEPARSMPMITCQCVIALLMCIHREELPVTVPKLDMLVTTTRTPLLALEKHADMLVT